VANNYREEKLSAYRAVLVNAVLQPSRDADHEELFIKTLDSLRVIHLRYLAVVSSPGRYIQQATGLSPEEASRCRETPERRMSGVRFWTAWIATPAQERSWWSCVT